MKFLVIILLGIALYGNTSDTYAWDSTAAKYMPLQVGNVWVYYFSFTTSGGGANGYEKYKITGTTVVDGKTFYSFSMERRFNFGSNLCYSRLFQTPYQLRIDSSTGNLFKTTNCGTNLEGMVDSLNSRKNDSAFICGSYQENISMCSDTSFKTILGQYRKTKTFEVLAHERSNIHEYTHGIGLSYFLSSQLMTQCRLYLVGCYVNGLFLGDTTLFVGISQIGGEIPERFKLSQNYPNPFNPVTKIKFDISGTSAVQTFLYVYNVLGKEVAVLVNQQMQPGSYEEDWDATAYPSGVYYFKLESGSFTETKKMVLIK